MIRLDRQSLKDAADQLVSRLRRLQLPLRLETKLTIESLPFINGGWVTLAEWSPSVWFGISFDRCPGFEEPKYWVGLYSPSEKNLRSFVAWFPAELTYRTELNDQNFTQDDKKWVLKSRPSSLLHKYPVFESYNNGIGTYYGLYDVGLLGSNHVLDVERAALFVSRVVETMSSDMDENAQGLEGAAKRKFVLHRKREVGLRNKKIQQAMKDNGGRLVCEVGNCGFDFKERYGSLGAGYAHVHHKQQLSKAPKSGTLVSLAELAIVCANCHAMIHKGGECRPLTNLIPSKYLP